jgi:glycerol-3-phosphate dehydrogenase
LNRETSLQALRTTRQWDIVIIGGGATGLGAAVDAAARGYHTVLFEQGDFSEATSSRSTKLIHGGLRYLRQGNVSLVRDALRERGRLLRNAPALVHPLPFLIPVHSAWERAFYGVGLKIYDLLAGQLGIAASRHLSREETLNRLPTLNPSGLRGGLLYQDAQFDDSRLAVALAQTFAGLGGAPLNYARATALLKTADKIRGVRIRDLESGDEFEIAARAVINATGVFCDTIRQLDDPQSPAMLAPSQGAHIVLPRKFFPGDCALMIPRTADDRVLFAIPWHGRTLIGTTDTPVAATTREPRPLAAEIAFLLAHTAQHLTKAPAPSDILSTFAGLRPLVRRGASARTASIARDHLVVTAPSGLITITGGKWTTYRRMAEDAVNAAERSASLDPRPSRTTTLPIDARGFSDGNGAAEPLHTRLTITSADVLRAVREEMARTVEDTLARRTRALFLDARAASEIASEVAALMAAEMGRDSAWQAAQSSAFRTLAAGYLPPD